MDGQLDLLDAPRVHPSRRLKARIAGLYLAPGNSFETQPVEALTLGLDGIADDLHWGATRRSGGREPWYPRGTEMRNERQLSIVAPDELEEIARRMALPRLAPEWIGANIVIEGVAHLSMLPAGTLLFCKGGVTIKVDSQNAPCKFAGATVAQRAQIEDAVSGALAFAKLAKRLRGLVAWVEKPGVLAVGEEVSVRVPEQWIY